MTFRVLASIGLMMMTALASSAAAAEEQRVLVVVPLGDPSPDLVRMVVTTLRSRMRFEVRVAEPMPMPKDAWYQPRKRWRAEKLLDALDAQDFGADVWRVAAITEKPISTTKGDVHDWGIAGLGSMNGLSSVFSSWIFARFAKSDRAFYLHAMQNLVLHEVGHTLGLPHCPNDQCIMADAKGNAVRAAKASDNEFCARCYPRIRGHLRVDDPEE
jgi:archaemetzincin